MKKLVVAAAILFIAFGVSYAGENPKLLKEIKRKVFLDLTKFDFENTTKEFVTVKFKVDNHNISIISIHGSRDDLTKMMMEELEEMAINTSAEEGKVYQYRFVFSKE